MTATQYFDLILMGVAVLYIAICKYRHAQIKLVLIEVFNNPYKRDALLKQTRIRAFLSLSLATMFLALVVCRFISLMFSLGIAPSSVWPTAFLIAVYAFNSLFWYHVLYPVYEELGSYANRT